MMSRKGNEMLVLALDIMTGEFANYYVNMWKERKASNPDAKYPCMMYNLWTPERAGQCKWMIDLIEKENNFKWDFNEDNLAGKVVNVTFREEEYLNDKNEVRTTVKPFRFVPFDKVDSTPVPPVKKIDMAKATSGFNSFAGNNPNPMDEDVPF